MMKKTINLILTAFAFTLCLLVFCACREPLTNKINFIVDGELYHFSWTNGKALEIPESPEKLGHEFVGWYWDETYEDSYGFSDLKRIQGHEEYNLYAKWQKCKYQISFDAKNDTPISNLQVEYESNYVLPTKNPEKVGYTFAGWYTHPNGQGENITENSVCTKTSAHTLYAHWSAKTYNVTYVDFYGNEILRPTKYGENYRIDLVYQTDIDTIEYCYKIIPTFEFKGWFTQPNGQGTRLNYGSVLTTASNHKIYAYYQKIDDDINFIPFQKNVEYSITVYNEKYGYTIFLDDIYNGGISVYDKDYTLLYTIKTSSVNALNTEGDYLILATGFSFQIFDVTTGQSIKNISAFQTNHVVIIDDSLLFQNYMMNLCLYNLKTDEIITLENYQINSEIYSLALNKKDNLLYFIIFDFSSSNTFKLVCLNYKTGEKVFENLLYDYYYQSLYFDGTDLQLSTYTYDATTGEQKSDPNLLEYEKYLNYDDKKILINNENHLVVRYYETFYEDYFPVSRVAIRVYNKENKTLVKEIFGSYDMYTLYFSDEIIILGDGTYVVAINLNN